MTKAMISVLVIEDEAPIRRFLKTTLSSNGYDFSEATNGREGTKSSSMTRISGLLTGDNACTGSVVFRR